MLSQVRVGTVVGKQYILVITGKGWDSAAQHLAVESITASSRRHKWSHVQLFGKRHKCRYFFMISSGMLKALKEKDFKKTILATRYNVRGYKKLYMVEN